MALSDEEKATLAALQAKENEPDDGGADFDVEWWEEDADGKRKGGRIPWSQGKRIYGTHFPDLFGERPPEGGGGNGGGDAGPPRRKTSERYFGRGSGTD